MESRRPEQRRVEERLGRGSSSDLEGKAAVVGRPCSATALRLHARSHKNNLAVFVTLGSATQGGRDSSLACAHLLALLQRAMQSRTR